MRWLKIATTAALGLAAAMTAVKSTMYTVDSGERAVMYDRFKGVLEESIGEGEHFKFPWVQEPYIFDIRTKPYEISSLCGTKDLHMVDLTLRVMYRPDITRLPYILQTLGLNYDEKVLPAIGNEALKAVVTQFDKDQLLTDRPQVSTLVRETLTKRAKDFNILIDDVAITHLNSRAVELKQQEAERSKFIVAKADQERRAALIRAEGESESASFISKATAEAGQGSS